MDGRSYFKRFGDGVSPEEPIHEQGTLEHEWNGKVDSALPVFPGKRLQSSRVEPRDQLSSLRLYNTGVETGAFCCIRLYWMD